MCNFQINLNVNWRAVLIMCNKYHFKPISIIRPHRTLSGQMLCLFEFMCRVCTRTIIYKCLINAFFCGLIDKYLSRISAIKCKHGKLQDNRKMIKHSKYLIKIVYTCWCCVFRLNGQFGEKTRSLWFINEVVLHGIFFYLYRVVFQLRDYAVRCEFWDQENIF